MTMDIGRPRDARIDAAVLRATAELLGETGYSRLSVDDIARRAATSKPAIYRRWPSKAHLVHEAVFPINETTALPDTGSLSADVREMLRRTSTLLTTPPARAALPGLIGEMAAAPGLHAALLERFGDLLFGGLADFLRDGVRRGEVRPDVTTDDLIQALLGPALSSALLRGADPGPGTDEDWLTRTAAFITRGISA